MDNSILISIKKLLGISKDNTSFDDDLILYINGVLNILVQLGVTTTDKFTITGKDEAWEDFIDPSSDLDLIIPYVYMKVRLIFDPPTGSLKDALKENMQEYEWRINAEVDYNAN